MKNQTHLHSLFSNLLQACTLLTSLLAFPSASFAQASFAQESHQSFESCSMIASEYLTVLQLQQRGIPAELLSDSLPGLSEKGRARMKTLHKLASDEGGEKVFDKINAEYARCAKSVYQRTGLPTPDSREYAFYFCAGENKRRYEIVQAIQMGGKREEVLPQLSENHRPAALALYDIIEKTDVVNAYDSLATELKHCLNSIP